MNIKVLDILSVVPLGTFVYNGHYFMGILSSLEEVPPTYFTEFAESAEYLYYKVPMTVPAHAPTKYLYSRIAYKYIAKITIRPDRALRIDLRAFSRENSK